MRKGQGRCLLAGERGRIRSAALALRGHQRGNSRFESGFERMRGSRKGKLSVEGGRLRGIGHRNSDSGDALREAIGAEMLSANRAEKMPSVRHAGIHPI